MKHALLLLNTYSGTTYSLGDDITRDGLYMKYNLKKLGYTVKVVYDATTVVAKAEIMNTLKTSGEVVIYYSGHGTTIDKTPTLTPQQEHRKNLMKTLHKTMIDSLNNNDNMTYVSLEKAYARIAKITNPIYEIIQDETTDQAMVFSDGLIKDDELAYLINTYIRSKSLILINDCCHSGTIWDLDMVNPVHNVTSISACSDKQVAMQLSESKVTEQGIPYTVGGGIFTTAFWKHMNIDTSEFDVDGINHELSKYEQTCVVTTSKLPSLYTTGKLTISF